MGWQSEPISFTHRKFTVSADGAALVVNDERFALDEIDKLMLSASVSRAQGSWGKITASFVVAAGGRRGAVEFAGGQSEDGVDWWPQWEQLVAYAESEVMPLIRSRILTTLAQGGKVGVGGFSAGSKGRYQLSAEGITPRRLFGKLVPWTSIADMQVEQANWRFYVAKGPGKMAKNSWLLGKMEWNSWAVPQLVAHFNGR